MTELRLTDEKLSAFYEGKLDFNEINVGENEYLIIETEGGQYLPFHYKNGIFEDVKYQQIDSRMFGTLKPRDAQQLCYIDSLNRNELTFCVGKAGTGKSLFALAKAFEGLDRGIVSSIVIFCNPTPAKDAVQLGFLPGDLNEKLIETSIGNIISSKIGDRILLEELLNKRKIVFIPMVNSRGYEVPTNSFVYFSEAQNLSVYLMQLFLQRIGEDCTTVIEGDFAQYDLEAFKDHNNGLRRAIEIFEDSPFSANIELKKIYRSKIADWADKM